MRAIRALQSATTSTAIDAAAAADGDGTAAGGDGGDSLEDSGALSGSSVKEGRGEGQLADQPPDFSGDVGLLCRTVRQDPVASCEP